MIEKFITKQIDEHKLNTRLNEFINEHNYEPYLFMNEETVNVLREQSKSNDIYNINLSNAENGIKCFLKECRVYLNNGLNFGEIEFR